MAYQLVYTSAARLLDAGRTGLGTIARSKPISPLLAGAIEKISQFQFDNKNKTLDRGRVMHVHRRITAGNNRFHVLSRIVAAGLDDSGRDNLLAHHLVVSPEEAARAAARGLTPADVLRQFKWLGRWVGNARFFNDSEDVSLDGFIPEARNSGPTSWASITGNPAHARLLSCPGAPRSGVLIVPGAHDRLLVLAESLVEFGPQAWSRTFTTALETTDDLADLEWIVTLPAGLPLIQARCASLPVIDLTHPQDLRLPAEPVVPASPRPITSGPRQDVHDMVRAPDFGTSPPDARPGHVRMTIAGKGSSRPGSRPGSMPLANKKTRNIVLAGSTALLVVAAVLGSAVIKGCGNHKPAANPSGLSPKLTDGQEQAIRDLALFKFPKDEARELIEKIGPNCTSWTQFIIDSNKKLRDLADPQKPLDLQLPKAPVPDKIPGAKPWAEALVALVNSLNGLEAIPKSEDWFIAVTSACNQLDNINKEGGLPLLAADPAQTRKTLFKKFATQRLDQVLKNLQEGKLADLLSVRQIWAPDDFPDQYLLLVEKIRDCLDQSSKPMQKYKKVMTALEPHKEVFRKEDYQGLVSAKGLFQDDAASITLASDVASITKSAMVPQFIKAKLNKSSTQSKPPPGEKPQPTPGEKPSPSSIKAPARQVVVVTREELKAGVHVDLVKEVMLATLNGKTPKNIDLAPLLSKEEPPGPKAKNTLVLIGGKEKYYGPSALSSADDPRYFTDGKFALGRENVVAVKFSYPEHEAWIAVDDKSKDAIQPDLKFKINLSGNTIQLTGTLAEWIKGLKTNDKELRLSFNKSEPGEANVTIAGIMTGRLPAWPMPSPTEKFFPLDVKDVKELHKKLDHIRAGVDEHKKLPLSKPQDRKNKEEDNKDRCVKMMKALESSIGRSYASKFLKSKEVESLPAEIRKTLIDELKKIPYLDAENIMFKKSTDWENAMNAKVDEKEIKKIPEKDGLRNKARQEKEEQISKAKENARHQFFAALGENILRHRKPFGLDAFDVNEQAILAANSTMKSGSDIDAAIVFFDLFLKAASAAPVSIDQQRKDYLGKIIALRVLTQKNRVLFEATKE